MKNHKLLKLTLLLASINVVPCMGAIDGEVLQMTYQSLRGAATRWKEQLEMSESKNAILENEMQTLRKQYEELKKFQSSTLTNKSELSRNIDDDYLEVSIPPRRGFTFLSLLGLTNR